MGSDFSKKYNTHKINFPIPSALLLFLLAIIDLGRKLTTGSVLGHELEELLIALI